MLNKTDDAFKDIAVFHKKIPDDINILLDEATEDDMLAIADVKSMTRRAEMLATRILIRNSLGYKVKLSHRDDGSPILTGSSLNISISHCKGMAVIATHPQKRIGIDVERWRNTLLKVKSKYLSPAEMEYYTSPSQLLMAWTCKEAVYKAAACEGIDFALDIALPLNATDNKTIARLPNEDRQFYLFSTEIGDMTFTIAVPA